MRNSDRVQTSAANYSNPSLYLRVSSRAGTVRGKYRLFFSFSKGPSHNSHLHSRFHRIPRATRVEKGCSNAQ